MIYIALYSDHLSAAFLFLSSPALATYHTATPPHILLMFLFSLFFLTPGAAARGK